MKKFLKNKINTFKANTSRFDVLSLEEWLNGQGLQENVENRALYAQYRLNIDEKNKQQDKNLSRFIGSLIWIALFLTIFAIALSQQIGATSMAYGNYVEGSMLEQYYQGVGQIETYTIPYDYGDGSYSLDFSVVTKYVSLSNPTTFLTVSTDSIENLYLDITTNLENDLSMLNDNDIYNYYLDFYDIDISLYQYGYFMTYDYLSQLIRNYNTIMRNGINIGYADGYYIGNADGKSEGYTEGYNQGYTQGDTDGYNNGYTEGYNQGYTQGDTDGYNNGYTEGVNEGETLKKGIFAIFDAPVNMLHSILNFEILGMNLYSIFTFIITLCLLAILTKTIFGLFN